MKNLFKNIFKFSRYDDFKMRPDSRNLWKQLNPKQSKKVNNFLSILDEAFLVPRKHQFKIQPKDKLGDIYKRSANFVDSFEIEIMVDSIFKHFKYKLSEDELSFDLSFEEIFLKVTKNQSKIDL